MAHMYRSWSVGALGILVLALALPGVRADALLKGPEWPLYQGGPGFNGVSTDDSVKPPFKLVWSYRLDGDATGDAGGGVTVAGGLVFVNVLNSRSLLALAADTGRLRWQYTASYAGYRTVPSYANGRLFLWERYLGKRPRVLALEASDGKVLWEYPLRPDHLSSARVGLPVADGKVFCAEGGNEPAVLALDERTGKLLWRAELGMTDGNAVTPPSVAGGLVYVATRSAVARGKEGEPGALVALDAVTGKEVWRRKEAPSGRPMVSDGNALASTSWSQGKLRFQLLDARTGQTRWTFAKTFGVNNAPGAVLTTDRVLIKPYGGSFFIADRATGKELHYFNGTTNSGCGTPVVAGDYAYVGTGVFSGDLEAVNAFKLVDAPREQGRCGTLHAVDLRTGRSSWFYGTGNTVCGDPAIAYGRLYFTSRDGRVYCFAPARPGEPIRPDIVDRTAPVPLSPADVQPLPMPTASEWPMEGGSMQRDGLSRPALKLPLRPAWKFKMGDRVLANAAIAGGKAFIGSDAGKLVALDVATGAPLWQFDTGSPVRCTPAVAADTVYIGSDSGKLHALDSTTGQERWQFACGGPVQSSPAVIGNVVIFAANDHHVYALGRDTGRKRWARRLRDYRIQAPVVIHGDMVYVGQWNDWVYGLDLLTGEERWRSFVPISIEALAWHSGRLYVRSPNYLVELDPQSGKRLRLASLTYGYGGFGFMGELVFHSGLHSQYGGSGADVLDLAQPGQRSKDKDIPTLEGVHYLRAKGIKGATALAAMTTPLVLGDTICFTTLAGQVVITDPEGKQLWSVSLGSALHSSPVVAAGALVVGCDDGYVYAFR
jgi:outer membrane protein assembly factor BamB